MSLDNETGLDRSGVRVRPVSGLVAADYFAPGYFVWAVLIANLAHIGYEEKTMYMAAYDWRLSFQNTEQVVGLFYIEAKDIAVARFSMLGIISMEKFCAAKSSWCTAQYVPSDYNEIFDIMNLLEDRLQHANGVVVLATIKVIL
uniref:Condensin complex subunit 1 C-terminal domain-containing protein n=1 Tax=Fagus sylvatica TaxID=28930 RepID=A0A2N9HZF0_FAGSY